MALSQRSLVSYQCDQATFMIGDKIFRFKRNYSLLSNKELAMSTGEKAFKVISANSGATARTIDAVHGLIGAQ